jgi:hypothetical protein
VITTALAVRWATLPSGASPGWLGQRLSAVRGFAAFAASLEEATQIPRSPEPLVSPESRQPLRPMA